MLLLDFVLASKPPNSFRSKKCANFNSYLFFSFLTYRKHFAITMPTFSTYVEMSYNISLNIYDNKNRIFDKSLVS